MEQSPSWAANSSSACREIPSILRDLKVRYRTHNIPPLVPVLSQINPDHVPSYSLNVHLIMLYLLCLDLPIGLFPHQEPCTCAVMQRSQISSLFFSIWSPRYHVQRSTDHNAPHYEVFSTLLFLIRPDIFLSTLFLNTHSLCSTLM